MRGVILALGAAACGHHDCVALQDADNWTLSGGAFGMVMSASLTMDADQCTFAFDNWDMQMESLPSGGSVDQDQVTLDGDSFWRSCTGTANEDGTQVTGTCKDGDDFTMDSAATGTFRP